MRRVSQRNSLVTLSDINITPLLDLAFVLLIIFVIISPSIRQSKEHALDLNLPSGGAAPDQSLTRNDIRIVEISQQGVYLLDKQRVTLEQMELRLAEAFRANPKSVVSIRVDANAPARFLTDVLDRCRARGITRFNLPTQPANR